MNDKVDTRVVRMEFDNKQFEKNIKQTNKSLEDLKHNLDFKGVERSIDEVKVKISALEVVTTTFIANLTNKIVNLGLTLVKSLSVDNISTGWTKLGDKTISVATMMAQKIRIAGQEITDLAEKTEVVNKQLQLLTWFSDETSYSFTDMIDNVGKFTAAGKDLDLSVKAVEGIATWAALSGQNAATASRAMYQLAQAIGKGKIQLIDWKSIQNANMDTEEFRETILATAVAMGQLTKEGDKFVTKTGKKFAQSQFTEFLSEDWFTSDVLLTGLNKYSAAIQEIYDIAQREGLTSSQVIEKYGDQLDEFGVKAFKAAQQARTFAEVLNAIKDAVSSKWMVTFENIFGNKDEEIELWSELADSLYEVFAESGNFRNNVLSVWKEMGGRNELFGEHGSKDQGAFWNLYDSIMAVRDLIRKAWSTIFPLSMMEDESDRINDIGRNLRDFTIKIREFTLNLKTSEGMAHRISTAFKILFSVLKGGLVILKAIRFVLDPIIEMSKTLVGQILDKILFYLSKIGGFSNKFEVILVRMQNTIVSLLDTLNPSGILDQIFKTIEGLFSVLGDIHPLELLTDSVKSFIEAFTEAGGTQENFIKIIKNVLSVVIAVRKAIFTVASILINTFVPVIGDITELISKLAGSILGTIVRVVADIADSISLLINAFKSGNTLSGVSDVIVTILEDLGNVARSVAPLLGVMVQILFKFIEVLILIPKALNKISESITGRGILDNIIHLFDSILEAITNFVKGIKTNSDTGSVGGLFNAIIGFFEGLYELVKGLLSVAQLLITALGAAMKKIGQVLQYLADIFLKVFTGRANELTKKEKAIIAIIVALTSVILIVKLISNIFYGLLGALHPMAYVADALVGVLDSIRFKLLASLIEGLGNALLDIAVAFMIFSALKPDTFFKIFLSVVSVVSLLVGIGVLIKQMANATKDLESAMDELTKKAKKMKNNSQIALITALIVSIGNMMIKVAAAMLIFEKVSWSSFAKGIISMVAILAMIGVLALVVDKSSLADKKIKQKKPKKTFKEIAGAVAAIAVAVKMIAKSFATFAKYSWSDLAKGYATLGSILAFVGAIIGLTAFNNKIGKGGNFLSIIGQLSAGLAIFSAAMIALATAFEKFDQVNLNSIKIGLLGMVGVIALLGISSAVLKPIIPTMIALASSLLMIGVAVLTAGLGLQAIATGMSAMNTDFAPALENLTAIISTVVTAIIESIVNAIPLIFEAIGSVIDGLIDLTPKLLELIQTLIEASLQLLNENGVAISTSIITLLDNILSILADHSESIANSISIILANVLSAIADKAYDIGDALVRLIIGAIAALTARTPELVKGLLDFIDTLIAAVFDPSNGIARIVENLLNYLLQFIKDTIPKLASFAVQIGGYLSEVILILIANALKIAISSLGALNKMFITFIGAVLLTLAYTISGMTNVVTQAFLIIVKECVKAAINAIFAFSKAFQLMGQVILKLIMKGLLDALTGPFQAFLGILDKLFGTDMSGVVNKMVDQISGNIQKEALALADSIGGSLDDIIGAVTTASANINDVIAITSDMTNDAISDSMSQIGSSVKDSVEQLGGAYESIFGTATEEAEEATEEIVEDTKEKTGRLGYSMGTTLGSNLNKGITDPGVLQGATKAGIALSEKTIEGTKEGFGIHSPSRVFAEIGNFLIQGLGLGIQNGSEETENVIAQVIDESLQLATDILDGQEGDDYTIKVGMDISSVEAQTSRIQDIMSGVNDPSITASGRNAGYTSRSMRRDNENRAEQVGNTDNSTTVTYNNTFNIESTDPQQTADEIDRMLQEQNIRWKMAHGGI